MVERIKTFDDYKEYKYELAGRPLVVKTGKVAGLANGAAMVQYGDTTVVNAYERHTLELPDREYPQEHHNALIWKGRDLYRD